MPNRKTNHIRRLRIIWLFGVRNEVDGTVQRDNVQVFRLIGNEDSGKISAAYTDPIERATYRIAAGDFLGLHTLDIRIDLVFELTGCVSGQRGLIAKARRPSGKGQNRGPIRQN